MPPGSERHREERKREVKEPWEHYTYRVFWSPEDKEYVGVCAELPGLSWLDRDPHKAFRDIRQVTKEGVALLRDQEDPILRHG